MPKLFFIYNQDPECGPESKYFLGHGSFGQAPKFYSSLGNVKIALHQLVYDFSLYPHAKNGIHHQTKKTDWVIRNITQTHIINEVDLVDGEFKTCGSYSALLVIMDMLDKRDK